MRLSGWLALVVVLALLGGGGYYARQRLKKVSAPPAPVYATATAKTGTLVADVLGFGPLNPVYEAQMQASASGTVEKVFVKQGDVVHKGEVLAVLQNPNLVNQIQQDKVTLQQDLQKLAASLGTTPAKAMQTNLDAGGVPVEAPQSGRVGTWSVSVGDTVTQGQTLTNIVDDAKVLMDAGLVPYDYQHVHVGDTVSVHFDQFSGDVPGTVTSIGANPTPGKNGFTYPAVITLNNPGLLAPQMKGQVTIDDGGGSFTLPQQVAITAYGHSSVVTSPIAGTVQSIQIASNGWANQGEVLLNLGGPAATNAIAAEQAQVNADQTKLSQDEQTEKELTVTSDLNGTVGNFFVQPGQHVNAGQGLGSVFNSQSMNMTIQVSELQVANVHPGQQVIVTSPGLPGKTFNGKVLSINTFGNSQNGLSTFGVQISVDATTGLRPGMTADARIVVSQAKNALLVPVEALLQNGTQVEVELLVDGKPQIVPVTVGLVNDQYAQITAGLHAGQVVITGMSGTAPPAFSGTAGGASTGTSAASSPPVKPVVGAPIPKAAATTGAAAPAVHAAVATALPATK